MTITEEMKQAYKDEVIGSDLATNNEQAEVHVFNLRILLGEYKSRLPLWHQMMGDGKATEVYALQMEFSKRFMHFLHVHFTDEKNVSTQKYSLTLMDMRLLSMASNMVYQMKEYVEFIENTDENGDRPEDIRVPEGVRVN